MASAFRKKTPMQLQTLERSFSEEKYPNQQDMAKCAESIGLTYNQVKTWFKERRRKEKREIEGLKNQSASSVSSLTSSKVSVGLSRKTCVSLAERKRRFVQMQVLFPKDYVLRKVFRKDGPPLGMEFEAPPLRSTGHKKDIQKVRACTESQTSMKKRKVQDAPIESSGNRTNLPKKHGMGKGLMTIWRVTNSQNGEFPCEFNTLLGCNASFNSSSKSTSTVTSSQKSCKEAKTKNKPRPSSKQIVARKKIEKKKPPNKRKVSLRKTMDWKSHSPTECELSAVGPELSEGQDGQSTLVDDEEIELREMPNPLRCSAHLSSSGRHGCALCKDLLARFPPHNVKMKQPFSARPWDSSPELVKKLFKVLRFLYTNSTRIDVHPFTVDEFTQSFHDKDSMLLGEVHMALLKLLLLDAEKGKADDSVPLSSKDSRFLSFLNFFREQELDASFLMKSLNPLTWIEILRQVLVAAGFGSKNSLLRRGSFSKEEERMVKYGLRPRTLKCELFTVLSKIGSCGSKVSDLAKSPKIIELDLPNSIEETEQLIYSTLSSDITLFEKIAPNAYRLRVDPRIKGTNPNSDSEDSGSIEDEESRDSHSINNSSGDESDWSEETSSSKKEEKIAKYREIDESYCGEAWVLGLMEGEYSDLRVDEKLDGLVALVDLIDGASTCLRIEEPRIVVSTAVSTLHRIHASGGKIKKSTYTMASNSDKVHSSPRNTIQAPNSGTSSSKASSLMQTVHLGSDRRYNNYWLFLGPCARDDPGHRMVFFESSEDSHWEVIDTPQDILELLSVLDTRGLRESGLFASLNKRQSFLCQSMDAHLNKSKGDNATQTSSSNSMISSGDGSSPISDIDNSYNNSNNATVSVGSTAALFIESGRTEEEKRQKWERSQEFDRWVWDSFYLNLSAVRLSKRMLSDTWARCQGCHDLYWREEKHCRICHSTFELDFEQEERYAMHLATCKESEGMCELPSHRVHASQLQALKAAIHAIEAAMPDMSLVSSWMKSDHKLWVNRLQRTSSLPELLQVLVDFVGAIREDWLHECPKADGSGLVMDDLIVSFQTMPQTSSAVALWVVRLDTLISSYLEKSNSELLPAGVSSLKENS
ncbi:Homeodomain-like transcriptional regulator [Rhynchospora pubera]|uniref:Homeodomain-like transcriptional regulator n=1 Tax=Rhynchospora pubera TaxID=906938 RepID=A0AAV8FDC7_9POAL|nr:Homeodomain-like transcriptional regulator [Rhynchospora pubera]